MIKKIGKLVGQIDCKECLSLIQWDSADDIKTSNGIRFVVCPNCGKHILLDGRTDYWIPVEDDGEADQNSAIVGQAVVGTAIVGSDSAKG